MTSTFKDFLSESFNDRHIYKAIFVLGLPAAGKSTLSKKLPCKLIDIDTYHEFTAWKRGRNIDDLATKIGDVNDKLSAEASIKYKQETLNHAIDQLEIEVKNSIDGVLPIIINLVGTNAEAKILTMKSQLESIGYDTFCVYVHHESDASMKGAHGRYVHALSNPRQGRAARKVDSDYIDVVSKKLPDEINKVKSVFLDNFSVVDSGDFDVAIKSCTRFLNSAVSNEVGKQNIELFNADARSKKYLSTFSPKYAEVISLIAKRIKHAQRA
jgi:hypothetical protein